MSRFSGFRGPRSVLPSTVLLWGVWGFLFFFPWTTARAQASPGEGCEVPHFDRLTNLALSNGSRVSYFSAPTILCAEGLRISADSAVVYEATDYTQLFGNVVFQDPDSRLTADRANYFNQEDRLRAWGGVVLTDLKEGSVIHGDTIIMVRAGPGRPEDVLTVLGRRPRARLYPRRQPVSAQNEILPEDSLGAPAPDSVGPPSADSAGAPALRPDSTEGPPLRPDSARVPNPEASRPPSQPPSLEERTPWDIDAQRIFLEGSRYFRAMGDVFIHRDSVDAVANSVEYDGEEGILTLTREARLNTSDFELSAQDIRMDIPQDDIREIEARDESLLEGEDLQLLAPIIRMYLTDGELDRLVAVRDSALDSIPQEMLDQRTPHPRALELGFPLFPIRPHAFAQDFLLQGDSIEVEAPGNVMEEVKAMGTARGESMAGDSLNTEETPPLIRRDWLEGDTIVAVLSPVDDSQGPEDPAEASPEARQPPAAARMDAPEAQSDSSRYRLDRLIAQGSARSLYRLPPSDSTMADEENRLAIHYVVGDEITILMTEGEVDRMEVKGSTRGIHLEPVKVQGRRGGGVNQERALTSSPPVPPDTAVTRTPPPGGGR